MNEKIILYVDGQLTPEQSIAFEKEIGNSTSLQKELEQYRKFISEVNELGNIKIESGYFNNLIPEFRKRSVLPAKKNYQPKYAFATAVLAVILVMFVLLPKNEIKMQADSKGTISETDIQDYYLNTGDETLLTNLPEDESSKYDSLLDGLIYSALSPMNEDASNISAMNKLDYNQLLQSVNQDDADLIYKKLINKKIF